MHIVIVFINIGDYHAARLQAAYTACRKRGWHFTAIQVTDDTLGHPWGDVEGKATFPVRTLLPLAAESFNTSRDALSSTAGVLIKKHLDELSPDAVLLPGWSLPVVRAGAEWCNRNSRGSILMSESKEDDAPRRWWREAIKKKVIKHYHAAVVGGHPHKRYLIKLGLAADRIFFGYDVVSNEAFYPNKIRLLSNPLNKPYFLAVNRFVPKKNLSFFLAAYKDYRRTAGSAAWDLVLCGDGPLRPQIEKDVADSALGEVVHLPGFLKQMEMLPYFAHAGCFIHASIQEQWGLVVNEAMAAGLPVLVSNRCGCFEDLVREGRNGFGFDPENSQELSELMLRISNGETDLKTMGAAALADIQKFSPDHFAQGMISAVERALAQR